MERIVLLGDSEGHHCTTRGVARGIAASASTAYFRVPSWNMFASVRDAASVVVSVPMFP
jgi:uncharacterized protein with ACT and thioredoxin-like domain